MIRGEIYRTSERAPERGGKPGFYVVVSRTFIAENDDVETVEAFFAEEGGDWPVVYDTDGRFAVAFGVAKVPETWIVDPDGIVRARFISQVTADFLGTTMQQLRELRGAA